MKTVKRNIGINPFSHLRMRNSIKNGPLKYEKHTPVLTISKTTTKFSRFF